MSTRPRGYGMTAELEKKKQSKFDPDLATDVMQWMKLVLDDGGLTDIADKLPEIVEEMREFSKPLKDGVVLCKVINVIRAGSVKKINTSTMAFKMMENISNFLTACEDMGCQKTDLFQTVDLYESQNVPQVVNGIVALGRKAQNYYDGPTLGPAEATENKRSFTDEQLRASDGIIGLQAGSNQGASQAGMNFGKTRAIID